MIYLKFKCVQRGLLFGLLSFINGFFFSVLFQSVVAGLCIVSLILRVTARVLLYIYTYSTFSDDVAHVRGKTHYSSTCRATALNTVTIV